MSVANIDIIPGTVHLIDVNGDLQVQKDENGHENVILRPPPSSNPNDPLRWSQKKKKSQFFALFWLAVFLALTVGWTGPMWLVWSQELGCTVEDLNTAMALTFLFLGLGCLFLQPTALKLGRRFVYLLCSLLMIVSNTIGSQAHSIKPIYAVFVIQGFAAAPCDSLVEISTTDVFFQHERASYLSCFILALYFGNYIGPAISGYIVESLGWRWSYYLQIILFGCTLVILAFYMEDTTFRRSHDESLETDILQQIKSRETVPESQQTLPESTQKEAGQIEVTSDPESMQSEQKLRSYWQKMKIIQTEYNDTRSWLCIWYRPFLMVTFPAVLWGGLIYGAQMMWLSLIATTQATIYGLNFQFQPGAIGLTNFGSLIGAIIGMFAGGKLVDIVTIKLTERNHGVMEPEFRLYAMVLPFIANAAGLLAYGLAGVYHAHWAISVVLGQGLLGFAMSSSGTICLTYAIDSYTKMASEAMVLMLFIRNMIGMGFTFAIQPWLNRNGIKVTTWLMFMLAVVINGTFIVMIKWGKNFRRGTMERYKKYSNPEYGELGVRS